MARTYPYQTRGQTEQASNLQHEVRVAGPKVAQHHDRVRLARVRYYHTLARGTLADKELVRSELAKANERWRVDGPGTNQL